MRLWFQKQSQPAPKYEYLILCPEKQDGCSGLYKEIQRGWEPVLSWREDRRYKDFAWITHVVLRRAL